MQWRILISAPYAMSVIDRYRDALETNGCDVVVAAVKERLNEQELLPLVSDVDGIICGDDQITARVLAAAPRLKVISKWGTGIDSIDQLAAAQRGVAVCNTPNAFSDPVADTVMGYLLLFARQFDVMNRDIRGLRWEKPQLVALGERTLGVIGVGNCGRAVINRAMSFGMRILAADVIKVPDSFCERTGTCQVELETLLHEADFVTLHTTLNPSSFHLVNERTLKLMKSTAFLINTSRGPVVDEQALIQALQAQQIAGAALDVFEQEPLPPESPLRRLENCWLSPHNANSSPRCAANVHENTIRNLLNVLTRQE